MEGPNKPARTRRVWLDNMKEWIFTVALEQRRTLNCGSSSGHQLAFAPEPAYLAQQWMKAMNLVCFFVKIRFDLVLLTTPSGFAQEQASWVCRCDDAVVHHLEQDFKKTLQQQTPLEQWAAWLEHVVNDALAPYASSPDFPERARQFLMKWSFYRYVCQLLCMLVWSTVCAVLGLVE